MAGAGYLYGWNNSAVKAPPIVDFVKLVFAVQTALNNNYAARAGIKTDHLLDTLHWREYSVIH